MKSTLLWSGPCTLFLDKGYYKDLYLYRSIRRSDNGTWSIKLQDPSVGQGLRAKSALVRFGQDPETLDLSNDVAYVKILQRGRDRVLMIQEKCPPSVKPVGCLMFISEVTNLDFVTSMGSGIYIDLSVGGQVDGIMTSLVVVTKRPTIVWNTIIADQTPGTVMDLYTFNGKDFDHESENFRNRQGERMIQLPLINGLDWALRPKPVAVEVHRKHCVNYVTVGRYALRLRHNKQDIVGRVIEVI